MNKALVSIIIPTYNRAVLIGQTLDSITQQTYTNWECIVVDDHSTDDTDNVLKAYTEKDKRFHYFKRPQNRPKGANACRNFGFENCKGVYINWFDSDDLMHPQKLELQVDALERYSEMLFTVCQTLVFENTIDNILGLRKEDIHSENFFDDFITNDIKWLTQAPLLRRTFIEKHEFKFDEQLSRSQERDFFVKVLAVTQDYHFTNTPLVYFRKHDNSISFGKVTEQKLYSSFLVDKRIVENYGERLSSKSLNYLKTQLKGVLLRSILNNFQVLARNQLKELLGLGLMNNYEMLKTRLAYFCLSNFKTGERLMK